MFLGDELGSFTIFFPQAQRCKEQASNITLKVDTQKTARVVKMQQKTHTKDRKKKPKKRHTNKQMNMSSTCIAQSQQTNKQTRKTTKQST